MCLYTLVIYIAQCCLLAMTHHFPCLERAASGLEDEADDVREEEDVT